MVKTEYYSIQLFFLLIESQCSIWDSQACNLLLGSQHIEGMVDTRSVIQHDNDYIRSSWFLFFLISQMKMKLINNIRVSHGCSWFLRPWRQNRLDSRVQETLDTFGIRVPPPTTWKLSLFTSHFTHGLHWTWLPGHDRNQYNFRLMILWILLYSTILLSCRSCL